MKTSFSPDSRAASADVMNVYEALGRLGNDRELLVSIIEIYLEDSPALLDKARRAVMANDPAALQRAAHGMRGLAVTLSAGDVAAAANRLEHMGASKSLGDAAQAVTELEAKLYELNAVAKAYAGNGHRKG